MAANSQSDKIDENTQLIHPECSKKSSQPSSSTVAEKSSSKAIKSDQKCFLFDMIVARLDILNITTEQAPLVHGNFNGKKFKITSNRINVLDFTTESIFEFVANPVELKRQLSVAPLSFKVTDTKNVLGYGTLKWPKEFLSDLEQSTGTITGTFEIELMKCDGTRVGTMLILVRLQSKCEEYEEDNTLDGTCRNANKEIHPNDVLFVVAEKSEKNCCCSQIGIIPVSDSDHDLQPKCLDLSSYRPFNSQNVAKTNILAAQDPSCQKIDDTINHFQKILEVLRSKNKETFSDKKVDLFCTLSSESCLKVNVFPSSSQLCQEAELLPRDSRSFAAKCIQQVAHTESSPKLIENEPQSLRRCPLCKENMEYLPKLAACPNCFYKPLPCFEEKPYNDLQNADEILKQFHDNLQPTDNSMCNTSKKDLSKSRCTCKNEAKKPCANCRIRKLCVDIFQPPVSSSSVNNICEQKSSALNCVSSNDNRPFLTKIFSELKDLYDIEEPKEKKFQLDKLCEKHFNKPSRGFQHSPQKKKNKKDVRSTQIDEPNETVKPTTVRKQKKYSTKAAREKAVKRKLYDYQFARQICTYKCGHKACVKNIPKFKNVPPNMGWLWNINNPVKWKPGTIRKPIKELMRYFLKDFPADTLLVSPYSYRRKCKPSDLSHNTMSIRQKPTLHVCKKNGEYIITMRPLKPVELLKISADPYENMNPIQFRIVKNPQLEVLRILKSCLKSMGFKKCVCHRPIIYCYCRSFVDKKRLEYQCRKECDKRQIESCCDTLILTDTSESEDEFDFAVTPPVGLIKPEHLNKTNLVNVDTQYNELDWNPMPLFPRPPNKYMQMYQCAVAERKTNAILTRDDSSGAKGAHYTLRKDSCAKILFGNSSLATGNRQIFAKNLTGARGEGDGFLMDRRTIKGSSVPNDVQVKYGGRGDPTYNKTMKKEEHDTKKKVNMLQYVQKSNKKMAKLTPEQIAGKRKEKMTLLRGASPPLLCTIDRRAKPANPCAPCVPCGDDRVC